MVVGINILIAISLVFSSFFLLWLNKKHAIVILLIVSVLLHKELFSIYTWDVLPVRMFMAGFTLFALWRFYVWLRNESNPTKVIKEYLFDPFILTLLLLWLVRFISLLFTRSLGHSLSLFGFFTTVVFLGIFLYISYVKKSSEEVLSFIKIYIFIAFTLSIFGYFQLYLYEKFSIIIGALWNIPNNLPRVGSTFWDVNHFASFLAVLLPVLGAFFLKASNTKNKLIYMFTALSMLGILFLTNSRSAWILAFVALLTFITIILIKKFSYKGVIFIIIALVLIAAPILYGYSQKNGKFRAEIRQYFHYRVDSFDSHFLLLAGAVEIFKTYPVFGGGYGGFFEQFSLTKVAPEYFSRDPAALNTRVPAHTIWGETLAETGLLGFSAFFLFFAFGLIGLLHLSLEKSGLTANAMFSSILGWMFAGIFYSYNSEFFWLIVFLYFIYGYSELAKYNISFNTLLKKFVSHENLMLVFLLVISAYLIFLNLGKNHLIPWDEAIYAKVAKNMLVSNSYSVMHWWPKKVWYEKPPLYMWLVAGFMKVTGINSLSARLPSAIFGFATLITVYLFGKKLFNKTTGFISALALVTTTQFLYYSRSAMLDVTTTFFITLSLYLYWLFKENNRFKYALFGGISCGLAVMTKDVVGLIPFGVIGLYELYLVVICKQKISSKLILGGLTYLSSALITFLPWHIAMYKFFGKSFINNYIGYHVFDRAFNAIEDKGRPWWWYIEVMRVSMRIWFVVLLGALPLNTILSFWNIKFWKFNYLKSKKHVFLTFWFFVIFVLFSSSKSKLVWYIMPAYPVAAIMVGYAIVKAIDFVISFSESFDKFIVKVLLIFGIITFSLTYIFINKGLVYRTDLTESQAELILLKDAKYGTEDTLYADRIELPLLLFYSESPFEVVDYGPLKEKLGRADYDERIYFITKESRLSDFQRIWPQIRNVSQINEWVLAYLPSASNPDDSKSTTTDLR